MAKAKEVLVGNNIRTYRDGNIVWFGVDLSEEGIQTENSKTLGRDGKPKNPREMVASTRSFALSPAGDHGDTVMLHYTRPMEKRVAITSARKSRAVAELNEEESETSADVAQLKALAKSEGVSLAELVAMLKT